MPVKPAATTQRTRRSTTTASTTTQRRRRTTATGGATSAQATQAGTTPAPTATPASGSRTAVRAQVTGFSNGRTIINGNSVQNLLTPVNKYQDTSSYAGGFNKIEAEPIPGGMRLNLDMRSQNASDKVSIMLWGQVFDPVKKELVPILFDFLQYREPLSKRGKTGHKVFDVMYADLNRYLLDHTHNRRLTIEPGVTPLFVAAQWDSQHRAGGPGEGTFIAPALPGAANVVGASGGRVNATGAQVAAVDIPIDRAVKVDPQMRTSMYQLDSSGEFSSRLEGEAKGVFRNRADWEKSVNALYQLASQGKRAVEAVFGPGWSLEPGNESASTARFYIKDEAGKPNLPGVPGQGIFKGLRVDPGNGLPLLDGYTDKTADDDQLTMLKGRHTDRIRSGGGKTELQVKYGRPPPAIWTDFQFRPEYAVPVRAGTTLQQAAHIVQELNKPPPNGRWYNTAANTLGREFSAMGVDLSKVLRNQADLFDLKQNRHKFVLHHSSGVSVELSLDEVTATTLRKEHFTKAGNPRHETFYVIEGEVDHKQLNSTNVMVSGAQYAKTNAPLTEAEQEALFKHLRGRKVTLNVEPTLHTHEEFTHPDLPKTPTYVTANDALVRLNQWLESNSLVGRGSIEAGEPKGTWAARLFGILPYGV